MKKAAEKEEEGEVPDCPHCHGKTVVRNGTAYALEGELFPLRV
jgi:hypothetical protein